MDRGGSGPSPETSEIFELYEEKINSLIILSMSERFSNFTKQCSLEFFNFHEFFNKPTRIQETFGKTLQVLAIYRIRFQTFEKNFQFTHENPVGKPPSPALATAIFISRSIHKHCFMSNLV